MCFEQSCGAKLYCRPCKAWSQPLRKGAFTAATSRPSSQARLVMIAQEQQLAEVAEIRGDMVKAEWGNQIRNYVFHPYKMVRWYFFPCTIGYVMTGPR